MRIKVIDRRGVEVEVEGGIEADDRTIEMVRDRIIISLRARRFPYRLIGRILGISRQAVQQRYQRIPKDARDYHSAEPMGWLDSA